MTNEQFKALDLEIGDQVTISYKGIFSGWSELHKQYVSNHRYNAENKIADYKGVDNKGRHIFKEHRWDATEEKLHPKYIKSITINLDAREKRHKKATEKASLQ